MKYITEGELRAAFAGGAPAHYDLPPDARLTPAARQYLMDLRLYRPGQGAGGVCSESTPMPPHKKPEHMTHLKTGRLVPKTHPRIALRGELDALEAQIILCQLQLAQGEEERFALPLSDALDLVRQVLGCEVLEKPLPPWTLDGMDEQAVHELSHHPQRVYAKGHVVPCAAQGLAAALMNSLRTQVRRVELCAARAFCHEGETQRQDLILALNRLSSFFYILQLRAAAREEEGR